MTTRPAIRFLDRSTPPHVITLVLMAGLAAMNMSVFLPSLPTMTAYFNADYTTLQRSVSLYLATTAVLQLFVGPISDRYGRRPLTLTCFALFLIATLGCLLASSAEIFLIFRMLQGVVAVGLVLSRAIVRDMVSQDEAASMIGYVTMGMALVPMVAPMIGGALDEAFGWQATFVFLLVAGAAVWALVWADQGETSSGKGKRFADQVKEYPELLTSPRFWGYVFAAAFASGAFFAFLGGGPFVASEVYGLSPFWSGFGFGAPAIGYAAGNFFSGRYSTRYGIDRMVVWGAALSTAGLGIAVLLILIGYGSAFLFFASISFVGIGNGLTMPNASAGLLSVRPHLAGTASGLGSAIMIGGGAITAEFSGLVLRWYGSDLPLVVIMLISSALSLVAILLVIRRSKRLADTRG